MVMFHNQKQLRKQIKRRRQKEWKSNKKATEDPGRKEQKEEDFHDMQF